MTDKSYSVQVLGKAVEITCSVTEVSAAVTTRVLVYRARPAQEAGMYRQAAGYGLTASEAVLDMLKANRAGPRGGAEMPR